MGWGGGEQWGQEKVAESEGTMFWAMMLDRTIGWKVPSFKSQTD